MKSKKTIAVNSIGIGCDSTSQPVSQPRVAIIAQMWNMGRKMKGSLMINGEVRMEILRFVTIERSIAIVI